MEQEEGGERETDGLPPPATHTGIKPFIIRDDPPTNLINFSQSMFNLFLNIFTLVPLLPDPDIDTLQFGGIFLAF